MDRGGKKLEQSLQDLGYGWQKEEITAEAMAQLETQENSMSLEGLFTLLKRQTVDDPSGDGILYSLDEGVGSFCVYRKNGDTKRIYNFSQPSQEAIAVENKSDLIQILIDILTIQRAIAERVVETLPPDVFFTEV